MPDLSHPNTLRVIDAIRAIGVEPEVRETAESTRTAQEAADALGVEVGAIAKTLVFLAGDQPVIVIASGAQRINTNALAQLCDVAKIDRADADAVRAATGYVIGGVSPAGLDASLTVFVEKELANFPEIWAAAGTPHAVFRTNYQQILALSGGTPSAVGISSVPKSEA